MHAGEQQRRRCVARRRVQIAQGFGEGRPRLTRERPRRELGREIVVERLAVEHDERALDQPAHRLLVQPFGGRIDRRQTVARLGVIGAHGAMLGVDHLEPGRPGPHLAVATHAPATLERLLLRAIEVEEPQRDGAGAVGEPAQQRSPAPYGDLAELDDALDENLVADRETADRTQGRAVLVPLRQQAQEITERPHTEPGEPLGDFRAYARQALDRPLEQRCRLRSD